MSASEILLFIVAVAEILVMIIMGITQVRSDRRNASQQRAVEEQRRQADRLLAEATAKATKIDELETRLNEKAEELVAVKLSTVAAEIRAPVEILERLFKGIENRLDKGDEVFDRIGDRVGDLKHWATANFATKAELEQVRDSLAQVRESLARLEGRNRG